MSTLSVSINLLHIFCFCICGSELYQSAFYKIEWTSETVDPGAESFEIIEVSLDANQQELKIIPTIVGLKDQEAILNNTTDSTFPVAPTFSITWDFGETLTVVDNVRIITNCGGTKSSLFCNNSILVLTNESTTYKETAKLTEDMHMQELHGFKNHDDCEHNILIVDRVSQKIEKECGYVCEQCLTYLHIDLKKQIMNTSYENEYGIYVYNEFENNTQCDCPSYNLTLVDDNQLEVWQHDKSHRVGLLVAYTSTMERLQMTWDDGMCRQSYLPNTDEFMAVSSWRAVYFIFEFDDTTNRGNELADEQELRYFRIEVEASLNKLFNMSWIHSVTFERPLGSEVWILNITSHDQENSLDVIYLVQIFKLKQKEITLEMEEIVAKTFGTDLQLLPEEDPWFKIPSPNDKCEAHFQTTTAAPMKHQPDHDIALIVSLTIFAAVLLIISITLMVLYNTKRACFKRNWHTNDSESSGKSYPKTESLKVNSKSPPLKTQETIIIPRPPIHYESQLRIHEEVYDGYEVGKNDGYAPVNQTRESDNDDFPERKISGAFDDITRSKRVTEFTNFEKDLKLFEMIGQGSYGKVYKAKWEAEFVAVKIFSSINEGTGSTGSTVALSESQYKEVYAEIILATSIPPHPNIIRINGFCRHPLCVVMEYMAGGSVQKLVYGQTNKPTPSVSEKLIILVKSCFGLAKLTEYKLHHRDIAARNILLGSYEKKIDSSTPVKMTDFGMTRGDNDGMEDDNKTKSNIGPLKWMAPESIKDKVYNEKTDVYMFGMTIWEILYGQEPYEGIDGVNVAMNVCMKHERPEFLWDLPLGMKTLIKKCWNKDPNDRPAFKEIAHKLEQIQGRVESDVEENYKMDKFAEEYQKKMKLKKAPSMITVPSEDNLIF